MWKTLQFSYNITCDNEALYQNTGNLCVSQCMLNDIKQYLRIILAINQLNAQNLVL